MRRLRLGQVWLLVSPGNPLKPAAGMAPLAQRLGGARRIADGRRIVATGIEAALGTRFTFDTLRLLRRRFPRVKFVWLMGADILPQLPRWRRWAGLLRQIPVAVLPRPGYTNRGLASRAARRMRQARRPEREAALLPGCAPGWVFLPTPQNPASATAIRTGVKGASS